MYYIHILMYDTMSKTSNTKCNAPCLIRTRILLFAINYVDANKLQGNKNMNMHFYKTSIRQDTVTLNFPKEYNLLMLKNMIFDLFKAQ